MLFVLCFLLASSIISANETSLLTIKQGDQTILITYQDLLEFTPVTYTMETQWVNIPTTYTGVKLADIIQKYQLKSQSLKLKAINDYAVEVPITDGGKCAFIAYLLDDDPVQRTTLATLSFLRKY